MAVAPNLRRELDELRREFESWRKQETIEPPAESEKDARESVGFRGQIAELNHLVQSLMDEAEERVNEHPVATVAGALALGIVIGRLTAR